MAEQPIENIQPKLSTLNINKFSFVQLCNDSKGKTNPSQVAGLLIIVFSCLGFAASIAMKFNEGILGASAFVVTGGTLLGVKSVTADKEVSDEVSGNVVNPVVTAKEKE